MTFRLVLGIDPGNSGAIAVLADEAPIGFIDMPTRPRLKGGGMMVDGRLLSARVRGFLLQHRGAHVVAVIERVQPIGGNRQRGDKAESSPTSGFRFGQADGIARGVIECLGYVPIEVEPQAWKRHFGLLKQKDVERSKAEEKDRSRLLAIELFPELADRFAAKGKGQAYADALLISKYAHDCELLEEVA